MTRNPSPDLFPVLTEEMLKCLLDNGIKPDIEAQYHSLGKTVAQNFLTLLNTKTQNLYRIQESLTWEKVRLRTQVQSLTRELQSTIMP